MMLEDTCEEDFTNGTLLKSFRDAGDVKGVNDILSDLACIGAKLIQAHTENGNIAFADVLEFASSAKASYDLTDQEALTMLGGLVAIVRSTFA